MTLVVHAYRRGPTGEMILLDEPPAPPHNDLGGFEAWRTHVWGSPVAQDLGLTLLPTLAETDVFAEGPDLDRLDRELDLVLAHLSAFAADPDSLRFRLENIREAIRLARRVDAGGVYIG